MKKIFVILALMAIPACITVRQSGAHDIQVTTYGSGNAFTAHTERQNSAQDAQAAPSVGVGDEPIKTAGKTAVALATGGASTVPQAAAAAIAKDAAPLTP